MICVFFAMNFFRNFPPRVPAARGRATWGGHSHRTRENSKYLKVLDYSTLATPADAPDDATAPTAVAVAALMSLNEIVLERSLHQECGEKIDAGVDALIVARFVEAGAAAEQVHESLRLRVLGGEGAAMPSPLGGEIILSAGRRLCSDLEILYKYPHPGRVQYSTTVRYDDIGPIRQA